MSAHFGWSRSFALFLPLAFTHAGAAPLANAPAHDAEFACEPACAAEPEPYCTCERDAEPHGIAKLVALADARGIVLDDATRGTFENASALLALLPLDHLADVRSSRGRLELVFDTGTEDTLEVQVPERTTFALDGDDERDLLVYGKPVRVTSESRRLRVHRTLRFELGPDGVAGVVRGDIEVVAGPFRFDLDVRVERGAPRHERDRFGRAVLAQGPRGAPYKENGRWVLERHADWLVLSAMGHVLEVGLGAPVP